MVTTPSLRRLLGFLPLSIRHTVRAVDDVVQIGGVTTASAEASMRTAGTCCAGLSVFMDTKVTYPGSSVYGASLASYWSLQEANIHPACIITPTKETDVSLAVFLLNIGGTLFPGNCNFAVRSGGHTPWAGTANFEGGITIDLQNLNQVTVSADEKTVEIGPGNRWGDVHSQLDSLGLAVLGGRIATVGVGGLVTGGGFSYFAPRYGFVCDTVDNFEVVLASGQIVNANSETNPTLWRALRGGSNNFGVVTAFTMRAFKQPNYWGGLIITTADYIDQQFQALEDLCGSTQYDPYAVITLNVMWNVTTDTWSTLMSPAYTKTQADPTVLRGLTSIPSIYNTMRISNSTDFAQELASPTGQRELFVTASYKNSAVMMQAIYETARSVVQPLRSVPDIQWVIAFQPQPSVIFSHVATTGGNSLGLDEGDGNLFNVLLTATWTDESDDVLVESQAKLLFDQSASKAEELGVSHPFIYLNYAASWQDPIAGYGNESKEFLQRVSKEYDRAGLFQKNVPGGFKLF